MLVSHRKKFIYTKTIKTAGTSVESYFEKYCMPEGDWVFSHTREEYSSRSGIIGYRGSEPKGKRWLNHTPAAAIKDEVSQTVWNDYFKFCVVRNPFTKMVSAYHHFVAKQPTPSLKRRLAKQIRRLQTGQQNPADLVQGETHTERFQSWVKNGGWIDDRDKYIIDDQVCVDYFILQEDLASGVEHVCKRLQIPFESENLPNLKTQKATKSIPIAEYYDSETIDIIERLYAYEIEKFGYGFP